MEPDNNTPTVFGTDITVYSDEAITEAIKALQNEQMCREHDKDREVIRNFKEAAKALFERNVICYIGFNDEERYLDSVEDFHFEY